MSDGSTVAAGGEVDDQTRIAFRHWQERQDLMLSIDRALAEVPGDRATQLRTEFVACLEKGGVDSVYSIAECIDGIRIPLLYPLVTEHFVHARVPPKALTQREHERLVRQQQRLAKMLEGASEAAQAMPNGPSWCAQVGRSLGELAAEVTRLASAAEPGGGAAGPGRPMRVGTRLALQLAGLFWKSELPMTERCRLIAEVVCAFVEPVTGEQIRQRIKDLRRRPRAT